MIVKSDLLSLSELIQDDIITFCDDKIGEPWENRHLNILCQIVTDRIKFCIEVGEGTKTYGQ